MARQNDDPDFVNDGILDPGLTLDGTPDDDPLDQGITVPDRWSTAERFGATAGEQQSGETLDQRFWQEEPDPALDTAAPGDDAWASDTEQPPGRIQPDASADGQVLADELPGGALGAGPEEKALNYTDEDTDRAAVQDDPPGEPLEQAEESQALDMARDAEPRDPHVSD
ncbi:hypothetical protein BTM25_33450 [Actinomadura rubteroloni]|uniref:DUF5709 domain-containing protein n=1 Tax=Actinomadura rubteroloni TaxID=1926885 RepID=A0A2P4UI65_9ACTN|nr:hypothetical protein [Actinomadura rubteroloni]POM24711.1 hypothetical protein BTM25_33450 [Actinomadura rubteroloni]